MNQNGHEIVEALRLAAEERAHPAPPPEISDAERIADFEKALLAATNRTATFQPQDAA